MYKIKNTHHHRVEILSESTGVEEFFYNKKNVFVDIEIKGFIFILKFMLFLFDILENDLDFLYS